MAVDLARVDAVGDVVRRWASCDVFEMRYKAVRAAEMISEMTGETRKSASMLAQPLLAFLERTDRVTEKPRLKKAA